MEQQSGADDDLIDAELEGLSDPFNATYKTQLSTDSNQNSLLLKIFLTKGISKDGVQKLINDLGDKYVDDKGDAITSAAEISAKGNIYIKLMEK